MKTYQKILSILFFISCLFSCKKFVDVPPPTTEIVSTSVYSSNSTAAAAVNGIYLTLAANSIGGGNHGLSALLGLSADEFNLYPGGSDVVLSQTYTNSLSTSGNPPPFWSDLYNVIYQANSAIEGIAASTGVTPAMKAQLTGEALFIRAFCHFYLVNLYGDVPLVTTTNYKTNESLARTPKAQVYQQMVADLKQAQSLLGDGYLTSNGAATTERVRPNRGAATALLARLYLYIGDWKDAEAQSTAVFMNANYNLAADLNSVFLTNSTEAVWQLELPNTDMFNTPDGATFLLGLLYFNGPNSSSPITLSNSLINSFEPGDARKAQWTDSLMNSGITYYFPYKYKLYYTGAPPAEYPTLLRLGEQYLIRAEARAKQNNIGGALTDLNTIRSRAGLANYSGAGDSTSILKAIVHERQVELFSENGHRWLDLKRTGMVNSVMGSPGNACAAKGGTWNPNWQLYPIPLGDIQTDNNLTQNPGYH